MATILLVGADPSLLEGLTQTLAAVGHRIVLRTALGDATWLEGAEQPLVAVVDRSAAASPAELLRLPLARGGTIVLYRASVDVPTPLASVVQRMVLADLVLPLERQRLVALVQHVEERTRETGRDRRITPPEGDVRVRRDR